MDKKRLHEIANYLHQIISYTEHIAQLNNCADMSEYAKKIKKSAYSIDAIISDGVPKKQKSYAQKDNLDLFDLEQFVGMRVMIVDDLDENIEIMGNIFHTFSCEVVAARSGEEAIEVYKSGFAPEVVCMDMIMPGIDGAEATRQLKALGSKAFFMAISALKNQPNDVVSLFDAWLPKPFTMRDIIGTLSTYKTEQKLQLNEYNSELLIEIEDDIKDELLGYSKNGAFSSLQALLETLPDTKSKQFLQSALNRMDFDSIIKSVTSS